MYLKFLGWSKPLRLKKLSWCWQTRAPRLGSVKVTKHGRPTIPYVRYVFLLVRYSTVNLSLRENYSKNVATNWNPGQMSLKVMESGTIR